MYFEILNVDVTFQINDKILFEEFPRDTFIRAKSRFLYILLSFLIKKLFQEIIMKLNITSL